MNRLLDAGIGKDTIEAATGAFLRELLISLGENKPNICHVGIYSLLDSDLLSAFIPNTKYILMVDGTKIIDNSNKEIRTENVDLFQNSYFKCLKIGQKNCIIVFYDILLLDPKGETQKLFRFLNIPWSEDILTIVKDRDLTVI